MDRERVCSDWVERVFRLGYDHVDRECSNWVERECSVVAMWMEMTTWTCSPHFRHAQCTVPFIV